MGKLLVLGPERVLGLERGSNPLLIGDESLFILSYLMVNENWIGLCNCTIFIYEFFVTVMISSTGLLGLHVGNFFTIHN